MIASILWTLAGLVLILTGANALTDGSSAIASRMGISDFIIGLTVVAFGTSAPELVVSLMAAFNGSGAMAVGNIVGSNIFNILVIIGITAMVRPIVVEKTAMSVEIPIVILSSIVLLVLGNSALLDGGGSNVVSRVDGIFMLVAFILYMRHTFISSRQQGEGAEEPLGRTGRESGKMSWGRSIIYVVLGLAALIFGGNRFVEGASGIASSLGVSDALIGLTIVAAGTSLPELATSIVAAAKGKAGLAVGNVIGSNIFNVFLILGATATIHPVPFGSIGNLELLTLMGASLLFLLFGWIIKERTITRGEGAVLFIIYLIYTIRLISQA